MDKEFDSFLNGVKAVLTDRHTKIKADIDPSNYPLQKGQCFYLFNLKTRTLDFQKGIYELLGYTDQEFTFDDLFSFIHPDDQFNVITVTKAATSFAIDNDVSFGTALRMTYRIKKKTGEYIKVLRQSSMYEMNEMGKLIVNYTVLSDISFLNTGNQVSWEFEAPKLEQEKFRQYIKRSYKSIFTERELEILDLLQKGATSIQIAEKLFISKHTVDTHRRKMLQKTSCENTIDLLNFYSQNLL